MFKILMLLALFSRKSRPACALTFFALEFKSDNNLSLLLVVAMMNLSESAGEGSARAPRQTPTVETNPLSTVRISFPSSMRGQPLDPAEASMLLELAKQGREILTTLPPRASMRSAGLEMELAIIDDQGKPAALAPRVLADMERIKRESPASTPGAVTGEYAAFNLELNSDCIPNLGPDFLLQMEMQLSAQMAQASAVASRVGARLVSVGILPSIQLEHLGDDFVTKKQRYYDLELALAEEHEKYQHKMDFQYHSPSRGEFKVTLDEQGLHILGPNRGEIIQPIFLDTAEKRMVRYNALDTSVQFHWGVQNQDNYVRDHRIADLISALMVGVCANSPLVLGGPTGLKENRLFIYATMLHPRRVILSESWLENPLSQIDDAISRGVILGASGSKVADREMTPLLALQLLQGTTWPLNRTVVSVNEGSPFRELRVEHRPIPSQPTLADTLGAAALFYGLMSGMPDYLAERGISLDQQVSPAELERRLEFAAVMNNVGCACIDGLQSRITWFDGRKVEIRQLMVEELLPVAKHGLEILGVSLSDTERYLGVIERRLQGRLGSTQLGVTPADIIRERYFVAEQSGVPAEKNCDRISRWLADMFTYNLGQSPKGIWDIFLERRARD